MSSARGTADLSPSAMTFTAASPTFYAAATGHTRATDPALVSPPTPLQSTAQRCCMPT